VVGEGCGLWDRVRLGRVRRPQGWGRTHDRVIAPCDAIKERLGGSITEAYRAYSPAHEARSGRNGRNLRTSASCWSFVPKPTTSEPSGCSSTEPPARMIESLTAGTSSFARGVQRVVSANGPAVGGIVSPSASGPTEKGQVALNSSIVGVAL